VAASLSLGRTGPPPVNSRYIAIGNSVHRTSGDCRVSFGKVPSGRSAEAVVGGPQGAGAGGGIGDEIGQRRVLRDGERDMGAAAAADLAAVSPGREVAVGEQPYVSGSSA
jgi:hypothetical protein